MSHDFNNQHSKNGNTSHLDVCKVPAGVRVTVTTRGGVRASEVSTISGWYDPDDGPAIALAILEAAGLQNVPHDSANGAEKALGYLIEYVGVRRANAKEAADRESLEGEALALCNAFQDAGGYARADVMTTHHYDYGKWMDAARKAREIHGATK